MANKRQRNDRAKGGTGSNKGGKGGGKGTPPKRGGKGTPPKASAPKAGGRKKIPTGAAQPSSTSSSAMKVGAMVPGERVAWICLHMAVFVVPIAMSNLTFLGFRTPITYDQFDIMKVFFQRAFMLVALAAWGWSALNGGTLLRRTKVDPLILVFLAWVVLTTVFSIHWPTALFGKYRRFEGLVSFLNYAVFFFLTVQLVDRPARIRSLARTLFFSGVVVSLYGLLQYLGADPINWGQNLPFEFTRSFSTYGNPDLLGGFLMFPLPISLALALSEDDGNWRVVYWIGFIMSAVCWVTAFTRGAWIGGAVGLAVVAFAAWRLRTGLRTVDWVFIGGAAVIATIVVARSATHPNAVLNVVERLKSIVQFRSGSALTRFQIWQAAADAIKDKPILGFGADTFRLVFPRYKPVDYVAAAGYLSVADNVHNYPLQLAAGIGIPGFALLYGIFGYSAALSAPAAFAKDKGAERLLLAGVWAAAAAYVTHLFFGLSVTGSSFLMWVMMGLVLTPVARSVDVRAPSWGAIPAAVLLAVCALAWVGNVVYLWADHYYLQGRIMMTGMQRVQTIERAISLNPTNDMYRSELGLAWEDVFRSLATQYASAAAGGQSDPQLLEQARTAEAGAERALKGAVDFAPAEYDNYVFLTNHYNNAADFFNDLTYSQKAVEVGLEGVEVERYGPAVRVQLGIAYRRLGQLDDATEQFTVAADMDPNYGDPHMLLGETLLSAGRDTEAARVFEEWLKDHPDDAFAKESLDRARSAMATAAK